MRSGSSAPAAWAHPWCAGWSRPATRCACSGRSDEKRRAVSESAPAGDRPGRRRRGRRRRGRVRVHRRAGAAGLPGQWSAVAAMRPGSVLVLHTTGSPRTAERPSPSRRRTASTWSTRRSAAVRTTSPPGQVTLFVGGADDAVERGPPVLAGYGDPILHVGPLGAGQEVKLVNNTLFAAQIGLLPRRSGWVTGSASTSGACWPRSPRQRGQPRAEHRRRRRIGRARSSTPSANSSARTSPWSERPRPNWAATSALLDDVDQRRHSGHEMREDVTALVASRPVRRTTVSVTVRPPSVTLPAAQPAAKEER